MRRRIGATVSCLCNETVGRSSAGTKRRGFLADLRVLALMGAVGFLSTTALVQSKGKQVKTTKAPAVTYQKTVLPLVTKLCAPCHSGKEPAAGISFAIYKTEAAMKADGSTWDRISKNIASGHMPPKGMPQPTAAQKKQLVDWIDQTLTGDCRLADPGRVTIRRLNREEYDNTVRDLTGLDLHLADDFPSDDVGYGFDNIGDVLSISPLLMEKYLAAAETIANKLIVIPGVRSARFEAEDQLPAREEFGGISSRGQFTAKYDFPKAGLYRIRIRAFEDHAGPENAKMLLTVDGKPVQMFEVQGTSKAPVIYEAPIKSEGGPAQIAAAFTNDYYVPTNAKGNIDRNLWIDYIEVVGPLGGEMSVSDAMRRVLPGPPPKNNPREYARKVLGNFASRAYRRPATPEEVERLLQMYDLAMKYNEPFERGIQLGVQATLVSPNFLFRAEIDPKANPSASRLLSGYELASRLSYFLWSSMPDDKLMALAADGSLQKPAVLTQQVKRMLADPKAKVLADNFAAQWLNLRKLAIIHPDPKQFPAYTDSLRDAMMTETKTFFNSVVAQDASILDFIDGKYTYVNEAMARHYGIAGVTGPEFRRVSLAGTERGGLLTQASVLTVTSNPTRTSPTKRGKWVLEQLLGQPPPPPPPGADQLAEKEGASMARTLRERMEEHRKNPACATCHAKMDPLGFGLENFDAIGNWRTKEAEVTIDPSGELPGGVKFAGPSGLKTYLLKNKEQFVRCLSEKLLTYALGRGLEFSDRCHIDAVVRQTTQGNYRFSALVNAIVQSDSFRKRHVSGVSK